jgi:hypothetical protein
MCPTGDSDEMESEPNQSVEYETIDLGAIYRVFDTTRLGFMFKNIIGFSFKDEYKEFAVPKYATLGLGLVLKRFNIDLALHGDPARTYVEQSPHLGATGTLIFKF